MGKRWQQVWNISGKKKYLLFILLVIFLELIVFDFHFWVSRLSHKYVEIDYDFDQIYAHWGLEYYEGGVERYVATDPGLCHFEITDISMPIYSIYTDFSVISGRNGTENDKVTWEIFIKDEGNAQYYQLPSYEMIPSEERTKWLYPKTYGNVTAVRIDLTGLSEGDIIDYEVISLNRPSPMFFSLGRVILLCITGALFWLFRGKSRYYDIKFCEIRPLRRNIITAVCIFITTFLFWGAGRPALQFFTSEVQSAQYTDLTEALSRGQVYLEEKPPAWLTEMENPYDTYTRAMIEKTQDEGFKWDYAYFEEKYYVYFGVVPVLLSYLPWYLITGQHMLNGTVVFLTCLITLIGIVRLSGTMIKKWFQDISFLSYLLFLLVCMNCYGGVWLLTRPEIYEVSISAGVMFAVWGVDLWLESIEKGMIVSYGKLALGSLMTALITGCRPPVFVVFLTAVIIFREPLLKKEHLRQKMKFLFSFSFPFVPVALGMMYYNHLRFGSVFDFGANYNLTTNDMTRRGFEIGRIGYGIFEYLIRPVQLEGIFPYVKNQDIVSSYLGIIIGDPRQGGIFMLCPFLLMGLVCFSRKLYKYNKEACLVARLCIFISFMLVIIEGNVSGVLTRYHADFMYLLLIAAVISACGTEMILQKMGGKILCFFHNMIFVSIMAGILISYLTIFLHTETGTGKYLAELKVYFTYMVEFWR